jgi:hypothetical protein
LSPGSRARWPPSPQRAWPASTAIPAVVRAVGLADVALALGLYVGPSWPWLLARAASNPAVAAVLLTSARSRRARLFAAGLTAATAFDLRTVARLRATRP